MRGVLVPLPARLRDDDKHPKGLNWEYQIAAGNAGWRLPFRCRGLRHQPRVPELWTLGCLMRMKRNQIAWWLWAAGTVLIVLSWMKVVSTTVGWCGFVIGFVGSIISWGLRPPPSEAQPESHLGPRCVSCNEPISSGIGICPKCGWTQPK